MSELDNDHTGALGEGVTHHRSPSMLPDDKGPEPSGEPVDPDEISVPSRLEPATRAPRGTVLLLSIPDDASSRAGGERGSTRRFPQSPAMLSTIAALVGAALGSAATAGLLSMNHAPGPIPADPMTVTSALDRVDHELAALKASMEGSAKQANDRVAKIVDRLDRADKAQSDAAAKLARTTDAVDRIDHRLTGTTEPTGAVPSASLSPGPGLVDPRRLYGAPILEGWVLRDVFNGGAMIQSPRNGILEVIPGDNVPGLGRIDAVRRQDGRWVVVTSRGVIVAR